MAAHGTTRPVSPPSSYSQTGQTQYSYGANTSDQQHGAYPDYAAYAAYANAPSSHGHGSGSPTSPAFGAAGAPSMPGRDFRHPSPGPSLSYTNGTNTGPESVSGSSSGGGGAAGGVLPSSKEREAMAYRRGGPPGGLAVANPDGPAASGVLQHQDGGRLDATPEDEEPAEVPPRYDTIPHDRQ